MSKNKVKQRLLVLGILLGILGLLLILTARQFPKQDSATQISPTQEILFESIAQGEISINLNYRGIITPTLLIVASPEDIDILGPAVYLPDLPSKLISQLRALDYDHSFAVLAMLGPSESQQYKISIQQIARQSNRVLVKAEFVEPTRRIGAIVPALPYHAIKVSKGSGWATQIQFILIRGDAQIEETTHFIP